MALRQPKYPPQEFARRGEDIYAKKVRAHLAPEDDGKFVAIDIDSATFEIDGDDYSATERLLKRRPQAQIWLTRVGEPTAYRLGTAGADQ